MLHVDQVRNSLSEKFHIADMKIYERLQERFSDGALFLQIYCPSASSWKCLCLFGQVTKIKTLVRIHLSIKDQNNRLADHLFFYVSKKLAMAFSHFHLKPSRYFVIWCVTRGGKGAGLPCRFSKIGKKYHNFG